MIERITPSPSPAAREGKNPPMDPGMTQIKAPRFTIEAREVSRTLQGAFAELLHAAGADPSTPQSIVREVGLNKNLAWKISRIVQAEDASTALELMPGASGIKIFLDAAGRSGVDEACIGRARDAVEAYEELIRTHSGDRTTLEMMGGELDTAGLRQRDEQHRKLLFQGASYVWGAQARVITKIGVVYPSEKPGHINVATVGGFVDFRRLRPDIAWTMAKRDSSNDDGSEIGRQQWVPLDPEQPEVDGPPLLRAFCSDPIPELRRVETSNEIRYELPEGEIGNTGALTCLIGMVMKDLPNHRTPENTHGSFSTRCEVPAELMNVDMFFHESMGLTGAPEVRLHSKIDEYANSNGSAELPFHEKLQDLGTSAVPRPATEVPGYIRLVESMFGMIGQPIERFRGYRVRIPYPAYPTSLEMRYPLQDV